MLYSDVTHAASDQVRARLTVDWPFPLTLYCLCVPLAIVHENLHFIHVIYYFESCFTWKSLTLIEASWNYRNLIRNPSWDSQIVLYKREDPNVNQYSVALVLGKKMALLVCQVDRILIHLLSYSLVIDNLDHSNRIYSVVSTCPISLS